MAKKKEKILRGRSQPPFGGKSLNLVWENGYQIALLDLEEAIKTFEVKCVSGVALTTREIVQIINKLATNDKKRKK